MIGPILLLAAVASPHVLPDAPAESGRAQAFQPVGGATAHSTVSIRIISGVQFGPNHSGDAIGGTRRSAQLTDYAGQSHPAELLEFQ